MSTLLTPTGPETYVITEDSDSRDIAAVERALYDNAGAILRGDNGSVWVVGVEGRMFRAEESMWTARGAIRHSGGRLTVIGHLPASSPEQGGSGSIEAGRGVRR